MSAFVTQALDYLQSATMYQALSVYNELIHDERVTDEQIAEIAKRDRFFLVSHVLHRPDVIHPWLYERCREVEANPDGRLDLWGRDHRKTTIITIGGSIQEILKNPEITIGIFSHTGKLARKCILQIKRELEENRYLQCLYPDIFYGNPTRQSQKWSEEGLIVKRKTNPAECTLEGWGLVDGQPIGKHWMLIIYDDVVVWESVQTSDQIEKTTNAWRLSLNLADTLRQRNWYIGTRYNIVDTYKEILDVKAAIPRIYPATDNGLPDGRPVFLTQEQLDAKKHQGMYNFACQMLQNPAAGSNAEFSMRMYHEFEVRPKTVSVAILCDYAGSRRLGSNRTAIAVVAQDANRNKYLVDGICQRLKLSERWKWLKYFQKKWVNMPGVQIVKVGYERYGAQSDIEHFQEMMLIEHYSFAIDELNTPREGEISKDNRIRRLQPDHENMRWFYPRQPQNSQDITKLQRDAIKRGESYLVALEIKHVNEEGKLYNLIEWFMGNEYLFFPTSKQKDFFDAMSRFYDIELAPPVIYNDADMYPMVEND